MRVTRFVKAGLAGILAAGLVLGVYAQQQPKPTTAVGDIGQVDPAAAAKRFKAPGFSPYAGRNYPTRVYWGDSHVHTAMSLDARAAGNSLGPEEALRFARGEEVVSATGVPARLSLPLDWLVVADHSDAMGVMNEVAVGNPQLLTDPQVKAWHDAIKTGGETGMKAAFDVVSALSSGKIPPVMLDRRLTRSLWERQTALMEKYNEPGPVHRLHRLRVDQQQLGQQPAGACLHVTDLVHTEVVLSGRSAKCRSPETHFCRCSEDDGHVPTCRGTPASLILVWQCYIC